MVAEKAEIDSYSGSPSSYLATVTLSQASLCLPWIRPRIGDAGRGATCSPRAGLEHAVNGAEEALAGENTLPSKFPRWEQGRAARTFEGSQTNRQRCSASQSRISTQTRINCDRCSSNVFVYTGSNPIAPLSYLCFVEAGWSRCRAAKRRGTALWRCVICWPNHLRNPGCAPLVAVI